MATTVVVFTGNSNTGFSAIEHLVEKFKGDVNIRAIFRTKAAAEVLNDLEDQDAAANIEVVTGDITKKKILAPVFEGANAAFFATPATENRAELGKLFVDACFDHGVPNAVIMSMAEADKKETLYQTQFAEIEEYATTRTGRSVTLKVADKGHVKFNPIIIRSAPFYQNFYGSLPGIQKGKFYYPLEEGKLHHVDFNDVGKAVAHVLVNPAKHASKIYTIVGDRHAGNMIASVISMKAGFACEYEHVDDEIAEIAFTRLGLQPWIAKGNVETLRFIRNGGMEETPTGDLEAITGDKPMRFGEFVKVYIKPMVE